MVVYYLLVSLSVNIDVDWQLRILATVELNNAVVFLRQKHCLKLKQIYSVLVQ